MTTFNAARRPSSAKLNSAERKLLTAVVSGTLLDLRAGDTGVDDPSGGADWGDDRTVRAELLSGLLTGDLPLQRGRPRAVKLRGARVAGVLDLESRALICPVLLRDCWFEQAVNFSEVTAPVIRLPGCHLPAFTARQLQASGDVKLDGLSARGEVNLFGARIGGQLDLTGAKLENPNGFALNAAALTVDQGMSCRSGFTARGGVALVSARIAATLDLAGQPWKTATGPR